MKVKMIPDIKDFGEYESGIKQVCAAYNPYSSRYGIEYVKGNSAKYDLVAVHAGMMSNFDSTYPLVSHIHGLYWTSDYPAEHWEYKANASVISSMLNADVVTVPSAWVAETLQRDLHLNPIVIPHGIEWQEWQIPHENEGYVIWNKNRNMDVCDPRRSSISPECIQMLSFIRPPLRQTPLAT